jgi:uncharacterized alpha-E superfamily protein
VLSRIAESLFWIGRYVERSDDTARILDTHLQLVLEDPWVSEPEACAALLSVMGAPVDRPIEQLDPSVVLDRLAFEQTPDSIVGALGAARENARRIRETISSQMWECLNTTWIGIGPARREAATSHQFFGWVRERAALVAGIADATMSRDEAWLFLVLGRSLERADMTARLVATSSIAHTPAMWATLLRSCGAYESYLRSCRGMASDTGAARFLLQDRLFPRSVQHALQQAEECLEELGGEPERAGISDRARRVLGRARASLEYRAVKEVLGDLPAEMEKVQRACSAACDAVTGRYFPRGVATAWVGERS